MLVKTALVLVPAARIDIARYYGAAILALRLWRQRRRERGELARMGEHELKDLGLVPSDLRALLDAPFWRCHPFAEKDRTEHASKS